MTRATAASRRLTSSGSSASSRAASLADAQARLRHDGIAYVPVGVARAGPRAAARAADARTRCRRLPHSLALLIDPFGGGGYRVIGAASADELARDARVRARVPRPTRCSSGHGGRAVCRSAPSNAARARCRGRRDACADAEADGIDREPSLPAASDAATTAAWIANVLAGTSAVPPPIVAQLGCCLAGARRLGAAA